MWCVGAILPDAHALGLVNSLQLQLVTWMLKRGQRAGEEWVQHFVRTRRESRAILHRLEVQRWSTRWLQRVWRYSRHRARAVQQEVWVPSVQLDEWRQLGWWLREQSRPQGVRHRGRFFARLMPREQQLNNAAGGDYRIIAQNRDIWREESRSTFRTWMSNGLVADKTVLSGSDCCMQA